MNERIKGKGEYLKSIYRNNHDWGTRLYERRINHRFGYGSDVNVLTVEVNQESNSVYRAEIFIKFGKNV